MRAWSIPLMLMCALLMPASARISAEGQCPADMVYIQGGAARIGIDDPARPWARPAEQMELEGFCIDRYEYPNVKDRPPRVFVSWFEADNTCLALGKRLCIEAEWLRACSGAEGRPYPYGGQREPGRCATELKFGTSKFPPAGSHPDCKTPEGVYDMDGSVSEWVADFYSDGPEDSWDRRIVAGSTGWYSNWYGQDCFSRHFHEPWTKSFGDDGFRCCKDAPPAAEGRAPTGAHEQEGGR